MSETDKYTENLKAQIDQWNNELKKLENEANKVSADMRQNYEQQIKELRTRRDEAQEKMRELQKSSDEASDDIRRSIENSLNAMKEGIENAWSRFFK